MRLHDQPRAHGDDVTRVHWFEDDDRLAMVKYMGDPKNRRLVEFMALKSHEIKLPGDSDEPDELAERVVIGTIIAVHHVDEAWGFVSTPRGDVVQERLVSAKWLVLVAIDGGGIVEKDPAMLTTGEPKRKLAVPKES